MLCPFRSEIAADGKSESNKNRSLYLYAPSFVVFPKGQSTHGQKQRP